MSKGRLLLRRVKIALVLRGFFLLALFAGLPSVPAISAKAGGTAPAEDKKDQPTPKIYSIGGAVTPPIPINKGEPPVTGEARPVQREGTVLLSIVITADGTVNKVKVLNGSDKAFAETAVHAAETWKFKPATKSGKPVWCRVDVMMNFKKK